MENQVFFIYWLFFFAAKTLFTMETPNILWKMSGVFQAYSTIPSNNSKMTIQVDARYVCICELEFFGECTETYSNTKNQNLVENLESFEFTS